MAGTLLPPTSPHFITICKKAYQPLVNENDELLIVNWGALRLGMDALLKEDASDYERAAQLWFMAQQKLTSELENQVSASAQGSVQMDDSFDMESFPVGI
jgi:hypothetical protein